MGHFSGTTVCLCVCSPTSVSPSQVRFSNFFRGDGRPGTLQAGLSSTDSHMPTKWLLSCHVTSKTCKYLNCLIPLQFYRSVFFFLFYSFEKYKDFLLSFLVLRFQFYCNFMHSSSSFKLKKSHRLEIFFLGFMFAKRKRPKASLMFSCWKLCFIRQEWGHFKLFFFLGGWGGIGLLQAVLLVRWPRLLLLLLL